MKTTITKPNLTAAAVPYPTGGVFNGNTGIIHGIVGAGGAGGIGMGVAGGMGFGYGHATTVTIGSSQAISLSGLVLGGPGGEMPEGKTFNLCNELFLVEMRIDDNACNHHHYKVWVELHGADLTDYGAVLRSRIGIVPAFGSEETREHFVSWLDHYKWTFFYDFDLAETKIPTLSSGEVKGIWFEDPLPVPDSNGYITFSNPRKLGDLTTWAWIVGHCSHPVYRMSNGWLFTNDKDALVFKMR
jgi:hypothetical protein